MASKELVIGEGLTLPLQWMLQSAVVYGTRGAGKSTFGRKVAEEIARLGQRFCAIDPTGAWWGLKADASGTIEGLPVIIFGGDHADVPLEPGAGSLVADIVAEIAHSVVLDLEHLSKGKQIAFLGEFLARLYHINREPLMLFMDEAQRYAPQSPQGVDASITLGAAEDIVKLGRKHGLGSIVFTQRGSSLNKEVSELADILIAFRTPGVLDQRRIKEWLEANATEAQMKEVMQTVSGLQTGTAIFASNHPALKFFGTIDVARPWTFDSSATPQVGQRRKEPRRLAKPDLEVLNSRMAGAIERAKNEDPKELRRRISELERKLGAASWDNPEFDGTDGAHPAWWRGCDVGYAKGVAERVIETVEVSAFTDEDWEQLMAYVASMDAAANVAVDFNKKTQELLSRIRLGPDNDPVARALAHAELEKLSPPEVVRTFGRQLARRSPPQPAHGVVHDWEPDILADGPKLGKAERQILFALQTHSEGLSRKQLALATGYRAGVSTLSVALGRLRGRGLITKNGEPIEATEEGRRVYVGELDPVPPPGQERVDYWMAKVGKAEREILRAMFEAHPTELTRVQIAERTGYDPDVSTLSVALGRLRSRKLIEGFALSHDLVGG